MSNIGYPSYPGLAEATARLNSTFGGKKEIERLPKHLFDGEAVVELAVGMVDSNGGVLVLTDRRILFVFEGWINANTTDFPLDQVKGVGEEYKGVFKQSEIEVHAATSGRKRKELELEGVDKEDARRFVAAARERIGSGAKPARTRTTRSSSTGGPNTGQAAQDPIAQLERLGKLREQGVLTDEEFAEQKAKILAQM